MPRRGLLLGAWLLACAGLLACAPPSARAAPDAQDGRGRTLTVFAASSLQEPFARLGKLFEAGSGARVQLACAGSQELRAQVEHGARADVFAAADRKTLEALQAQGLARAPQIFARNQPVIAVPKGNPAGIRGLADLPRARRIVVGTPEVPIGAYTALLLERASATALGADFRARVEARIVSRELNVRQVLAKVALGEADAAIVYRTDALALGAQVEAVALPQEVQVLAEDALAALPGGTEPALADAFVRLVLSPAGQEVLRAAGFAPPPELPAPLGAAAR